MKRTLLAALAIMLSLPAFCQNYTFSNSSGTYTNLTNATLLSGNVAWDDTAFTVSLPFPFSFAGTAYNELEVESNGLIYLGSSTGIRLIIPFDADLVDLGTSTSASPISYNISGSTGSRIIKVEWQNAGFYDDPSFSDAVNFQVWLYEGSNRIEMRYGPSKIQNFTDIFGQTSGPDVGVVTNLNVISQTFSGVLLEGNPTSPTAVTFNNQANIVYLTGVPDNGRIYTFSPGTSTGVADAQELASLAFYPNPVNDKLHIKGLETLQGKPVQVKVFDVSGRRIFSTEVTETQPTLNLSSLNSGIYMLEFYSGNARVSSKFIKQ